MRLPPRRPLPGRGQTGATAVEMALILPVLLLMLFGIIDLANLLRIQITLNSAVTNAARQVALDPNVRTESAVNTFSENHNLASGVRQYLGKGDGGSGAYADPPVFTLSPEHPSCTSSSCDAFELGVTYTYHALTSLTKPFFDGLVLSASVKKTAEPGT